MLIHPLQDLPIDVLSRFFPLALFAVLFAVLVPIAARFSALAPERETTGDAVVEVDRAVVRPSSMGDPFLETFSSPSLFLDTLGSRTVSPARSFAVARFGTNSAGVLRREDALAFAGRNRSPPSLRLAHLSHSPPHDKSSVWGRCPVVRTRHESEAYGLTLLRDVTVHAYLPRNPLSRELHADVTVRTDRRSSDRSLGRSRADRDSAVAERRRPGRAKPGCSGS